MLAILFVCVRGKGVSNWQIRNLQRMVDLGLELPATNQVEAHIGYVEDDLLSFCKKHGIVVQVQTEGMVRPCAVCVSLSAACVPCCTSATLHRCSGCCDDGRSSGVCGRVKVGTGFQSMRFCAAQAATPLGRSMPDLVKPGADPLVTSIAQKYKKSPAQVSLRFLLDKASAHPSLFQCCVLCVPVREDALVTSRMFVGSW